MRNLHKMTVSVFLACTLLIGFMTDFNAFMYGVCVSLANFALYYGFFWRHNRQVSAYPGQGLVGVVSSTVTRFLFVGMLLVYGLTELQLQPKLLILGFVLGQVFYLLNQLITVKTKHGK